MVDGNGILHPRGKCSVHEYFKMIDDFFRLSKSRMFELSFRETFFVG